MEEIAIKKWASAGRCSGAGAGYGDGAGSGYGDGSGDGTGWGDGFGTGWGDGSGAGSGAVDGTGWGAGDGSGSGWGAGDGSGSGYGSGTGWGDGSGTGGDVPQNIKIKRYNGKEVYYIDDTPTIINRVIGNYAKGFIVSSTDTFQIVPCYIAKDENLGIFAHGDTLNAANNSLQDKVMDSAPVEERIELFLQKFEKGKKYKGSDFFDWHHLLTGSCLFGREEFIKEHNLSLNDEYSVDDFIRICENAYGSDVIKALKERWNNH